MIIPLLKQQRQHPAYPVYAQLRSRWQELSRSDVPHLVTAEDAFTEHKVKLVEEAMLEKDTIIAECSSGKLLHLIPCKLVYLEGELTLIAEETHDHSLLSVNLAEISNIKKAEKVKSPRAS